MKDSKKNNIATSHVTSRGSQVFLLEKNGKRINFFFFFEIETNDAPKCAQTPPHGQSRLYKWTKSFLYMHSVETEVQPQPIQLTTTRTTITRMDIRTTIHETELHREHLKC